MAITATSTLYDVQKTSPISRSGDNQVIAFNYLQAAVADVGTASVAILPKGKIRIDFNKSKIIPEDAAASATLSVGYAAYTDANGKAFAADPNAFLDAYDISTSPAQTVLVAPVGESEQKDFNTAAGLTITITVAGGNMDQNDTVKGWFYFRYQE